MVSCCVLHPIGDCCHYEEEFIKEAGTDSESGDIPLRTVIINPDIIDLQTQIDELRARIGKKCYSVKEIDELRVACERRWLYGTTRPSGGQGVSWSRSYEEEEMTSCVEELVRTYMIAGVTAEDIYKEDTK